MNNVTTITVYLLKSYVCCYVFKALKAMASAPPLETSALVGHPPLPSYEEAMVSNPQYPSMPHAPGDMKTSVPQDPAQAYSPMYPPPPQQGQPVTTPVGNGTYSYSTMAFSDHIFQNSSIYEKKVVHITQKIRIL